MLVLVGSTAGSAVWFTILQKWVIGAFCPYCMTMHITGLLLAALVIWRASVQFDDDVTNITMTNSFPKSDDGTASNTSPRRLIGPFPAFALSLVGLVLAGILAASQMAFTPPAIYHGGQSQENLSTLDPRSVPLVGSPAAPYVVALLFDYQCPHCQQMHFMLEEVIRRYRGKLSFALCPTPLNSRCNPYIAQDAEEYKDSCELVKVGLAVWVANHEAFPTFENWMFSFESGNRWRPRSLEAARAKAVELVGQAKFDIAWADPWIDRYLQTSIRIYGATIQNGNNAVPKLIFGSRWVIPQPYDADSLVQILQDSLAVPKPSP
jgi:protein-disulfide isomerase